MAAAAQDQRPLKYRRMDQQVSARLHHQLDTAALAPAVRLGRPCGGAGVTGCVAGRAPSGARARRQNQRQYAGQHDRVPPPGAARPDVAAGAPPRPGPAPGPRCTLSHHRDPSHPASVPA